VYAENDNENDQYVAEDPHQIVHMRYPNRCYKAAFHSPRFLHQSA
jgi:hypothetical protein